MHNKLLEFHVFSDFHNSTKADIESVHKQPSTLPSFAYFSLHSVRWTFPGDSSESELDLLDAAPRHNIVDPTTAAAAAYKPWMSESKHVYTCNLATLITPVSMDHA